MDNVFIILNPRSVTVTASAISLPGQHCNLRSKILNHFNLLDEEPRHPVQLFTPLRDSPAGVKEGRRLPQPETLQHVEDMAKKLLLHDEAAAVMRHCWRVSSNFQ